ncbi:hypothetical protein Tco_1165866 [Tanacetum coccineum]
MKLRGSWLLSPLVLIETCSVEGNVVGLDLCDNVGIVGLNLSPNRQCLSQSSSAPSRDPGLQLLEVPPVGPSVFPSTCVCQSTSVPSSDYSLHTSGVSPAISKCSQLLPHPIAIVDIKRPPIRNNEHYGDAIHAPHADTSSNWPTLYSHGPYLAMIFVPYRSEP